MVKHLIFHGANVNQGENTGMTPLYIASANGYLEIVEYLISHGANVNQGDDDGDTSLRGAAYAGHLEVAKYLVSHGANINQNNDTGITPLHVASHNGHPDMVKYLIFHSVDPHNQNAQRRAEAMINVVNRSDDNGDTSLHFAVINNQIPVIKLLLRYGANPFHINNDGETPIDYNNILESLHNYQNTHPDVSTLVSAIKSNDLILLSYLIGRSKNLNIQDEMGRTALHYALLNNNISAYQNLLDAGADPRIRDHYGKTSWDYFRQKGEYLSILPVDLLRLIIESM